MVGLYGLAPRSPLFMREFYSTEAVFCIYVFLVLLKKLIKLAKYQRAEDMQGGLYIYIYIYIYTHIIKNPPNFYFRFKGQNM